MSRERFPPVVYRVGEEPDPRFTLANERTFLAWIRTSLAFVAAGVALEALKLPIRADLRFASALVFIALGLLAAAQSWIGWARTERSMRDHRALPAPVMSIIIAIGVVVAAVLIVIGLFL
jgi:putative membrane protein